MWSFKTYINEAIKQRHQRLESTSRLIASTIIKNIVANRESGGWFGEDGESEEYTPIEYKLKRGPHRFVKFAYYIKRKQEDIDYLEDNSLPFSALAGYKIKKEYDYDGQQYDSPSVTVWIKTMYWPFPKELLNSLYQKLIEVIRHEMEHHNQFKGNLKKFNDVQRTYKKQDDEGDALFGHKNKQQAWSDYVSQPIEVQAHVAGLYLKAKKQRTPVTTLIQQEIDEYKQKFLRLGDTPEIAQNRADRIKKLWLDYANKRFPLSKTM